MGNRATTGKKAQIERRHVRIRSNKLGVVAGIAQAFGYLNERERRRAVGVVVSTFVNAVLALVGLASVLPFFQLLVKPDPLARGTLIGDTFYRLGVTSEFDAIVLTGLVIVALIVAKNIFTLFHTRLTGRFCAALETRIASDLLKSIVDAPLGWYLRQNASMLRDSVMTHVTELVRGVIRQALSLANNGLMMLTALALLIPLTPVGALAVIAVTMVIGVGFLRLSRPRIALASERKRHNSMIAGVAATEAISGGRDVRMSRAGDVLKAEFHRNYAVYAFSDADARQWQLVPRAGIEVIGMSAVVAIAVLALFLGVNRLEVASMLTLYAVIAVRLLPVIGETANALSSIQISLPAMAHLDELRRGLPPACERSVPPIPEPWARIELRDVHYAYGGGSAAAAIDGIDLTIERGKSYGIVGASGAGKSTLVDIVAGLLLPTQGTVLVDDYPLSDEDLLAEWRRRVSYVAQSPLIFDMSLAENIALRPLGTAHDVKLGEAIAAAGLTDVVARLERKENTPIGDRGTRLSGGQRQRVAIARAIYQNADLMVLDEATSALDSLTEREVADAIDSLKGKVTIIAIAHRLSTIMHCDQIVLLREGRIVARGMHSELASEVSEYKRFISAQNLLPVSGKWE
ncbi:ABC transporter ATP-binding protein [Hyphomicrobium sp.]|uniref:ABC transporter ATP-binding protein n=1 Tax=Hyphomicrobium sp. TaxID=82 RepID=UPI0025C515CF|nr:ABC transporter ATP-binding protein [Hyphomicrobium sp.]MCC7250945.1 ABC transporter ATP-binding protein [Hyphomicrobium sp.]